MYRFIFKELNSEIMGRVMLILEGVFASDKETFELVQNIFKKYEKLEEQFNKEILLMT
ncbi:MAG: hypothetical protein GON13_03115 [Nanoarchaeota archaeon]|nr:hypothetical protein [Nanoarchaeota archaeon]